MADKKMTEDFERLSREMEVMTGGLHIAAAENFGIQPYGVRLSDLTALRKAYTLVRQATVCLRELNR